MRDQRSGSNYRHPVKNFVFGASLRIHAMKQKHNITEGLIVVGISLLVLGGVFFVLTKNSSETIQVGEGRPGENVAGEMTSDPEFRNSIAAAVQAETNSQTVLDVNSIRATQQIDMTGDGVPEYLVNLGPGGASNDAYALIMMENGQPTLARFRAANNETYWESMLTGSGGAGRFFNDFVLDPSTRTIYFKSFSIYGELGDYCLASAYTWDEASRTFAYNSRLSITAQADMNALCRGVQDTNAAPVAQ